MILPKLTIPLNLENIAEKESKLSKKDKKAKEHLESSSEITRRIGYDDIKMANYKINKTEPEIEVVTQGNEKIEKSDVESQEAEAKKKDFKETLSQELQKEIED